MPGRPGGLTALIVFLCACGPRDSSGDVAFTIKPQAARAGDPVELILRNRSGELIGYNLCTSRLESWNDGQWLRLPPERACTVERRTLSPGEIARYPLDLAPDLTPGEYRYMGFIARLEARARDSVATGPFQVVP